MIEFFRDILNGPLYIVTTIISVILIMAIIGYLMEKKKIERDLKSKVAVIETPSSNSVDTITPIQPVTSTKEVSEEVSPISNTEEENPSLEVKTPVIVFEDPDEKK